ncbi:uncharacterized protein [Antedon mediterranea]|uniref:uncharacterized protein n=1 Tax=Antedon mediterranea TaxID=105859 RepID=UPI003AF80B1E
MTLIPAIPVIAKALFTGETLSKEVSESHAVATLIESIKGIHDEQIELETAFAAWDEDRKRLIIKKLQAVVEEMKTRKKRSGIAKLTGAATSIVGTAVSVGAVGLSFVTAGLATPIAVATVGGVVVGATGGVVVGGASIADEILKSKSVNRVIELIKKDEMFQKIENLQKRYQDLKVHMETAEKFDMFMVVFKKVQDAYIVTIRIGKILEKVIGTVKEVNQVSEIVSGKPVTVLRIVTDSGSFFTGALESTITAGKTAFIRAIDGIGEAAVKTFGITALKAAGVAVGVLAIGFDIYTIVKTSIDMHEGNLDNAATEIEGIIKELEGMTSNDVILQSLCSVADKYEIES